jgi:hypothetical protein
VPFIFSWSKTMQNKAKKWSSMKRTKCFFTCFALQWNTENQKWNASERSGNVKQNKRKPKNCETILAIIVCFIFLYLMLQPLEPHHVTATSPVPPNEVATSVLEILDVLSRTQTFFILDLDMNIFSYQIQDLN